MSAESYTPARSGEGNTPCGVPPSEPNTQQSLQSPPTDMAHARNVFGDQMIPKRAQQACVRCRKQKLKCDDERPCTLCVRARISCQEQPQPLRKRRKAIAESSNSGSFTQQSFLPSASRPPNDHSNRISSANTGASDVRQRQETEMVDQQTALQDQGISIPTCSESTSSYELVHDLFRCNDTAPPNPVSADAIFRGHVDLSSFHADSDRIPVSELIGIDLPPPYVTWLLFETFIESVHWFMLVFHEPSLRKEIQKMLISGMVSRHKLPMSVLITTILGTGAAYTPNSVAERSCPGWDLNKLRSKLIRVVEEKFLHIFDNGDTEGVAICVLLASYYIYHAEPHRGWVVLGAGWKAAEALRLHREETWPKANTVQTEVRRRVWWALYVADGFAALSNGKPRLIPQDDWKVSMPHNLDDTTAQRPGFQSMEASTNANGECVTVLTYQLYKFQLYKATSSLTREVYGHQRFNKEELIAHIGRIDHQLVKIWDSIPPELRVNSFPEEHSSRESCGIIERVFRLQALALQLLYDNLQLILHRPLLKFEIFTQELRPLQDRNAAGQNDSAISELLEQRERELKMNQIITSSRSRMWESAIRTSWLIEQPHTLKLATNTHAAAYIAIQTFTAGVTLGLFAMSSVFSPQSQIAKKAIGRLIKAPKSFGYSTAASEQYGLILRDLIQLVFKAEMKCLEAEHSQGDAPELLVSQNQQELTLPTPFLRAPTALDSPSNAQASLRDLDGPQEMEESIEDGCALPDVMIDGQNGHLDSIGMLEASEATYTRTEVEGWPTGASLSDALASLQQHVFKEFSGVASDSGIVTTGPHQRHSNWDQPMPEQLCVGETGVSNRLNFSPVNESHSGGLAAFSSVGQTWVWEDFLNGC